MRQGSFGGGGGLQGYSFGFYKVSGMGSNKLMSCKGVMGVGSKGLPSVQVGANAARRRSTVSMSVEAQLPREERLEEEDSLQLSAGETHLGKATY